MYIPLLGSTSTEHAVVMIQVASESMTKIEHHLLRLDALGDESGVSNW